MQKLLLLGALLLSGSALAFDGTPRTDWLGKSVTATTLPHSGQPYSLRQYFLLQNLVTLNYP